jgi:hypothetical protein
VKVTVWLLDQHRQRHERLGHRIHIQSTKA